MHTLKLKHVSHEFHYPDFHESAIWVRHVLSSEIFWAVFAMVALIGILITLAIFAGSSDMQAPEFPLGLPYYPYYP